MVESKHRSLIEASFLTTIMVVLFLLFYYQPLFGLLGFVWGIPLGVLVARQGLRYGILSIICTVGILTLLASYIVWPAILPVLAINYFVGWGLYKDWKPFKLWSITTIVGLGAMVFSIYVALYTLGLTDYHTWYPKLQEFFNQETDLLYKWGMVKDTANLQAMQQQILDLMLMSLPINILFAGFFYAVLNYNLALVVLKRLGFYRKNTLPKLSTWRFPIFFAYLFGFAILGEYWGREMGWLWLTTLSINAKTLASIIGFVQALALINYFKEVGKISKKILTIIVVLCVINPALVSILSLVGYMDIIFDFRKKFEEKKG